jgi:putative DNA primase/helicase
MPGASVVVCEGEKAADAAALIFPKSVCLTSAGGCKAEAKANFEPLAGRRVLIWPDADEPGARYADAVAGILHALGCEVSIIDEAGMSPDGGSRKPVKGWRRDWCAGHRGASQGGSRARQAFRGRAGIRVLGGPFKMDPKGLTTEVTKRRGENTTTETIWIASAFEVIGACRDPHGFGWASGCDGKIMMGAFILAT